jgi:hypothetical protein
MIAYHFLKADMKTGNGQEKAWTVGEERTHKAKTLVICVRGYHSSPSLWDALEYAPGPMATVVEISEPEGRQDDKYVSRTRKLLCAVNIETELRQFAIDCAERALLREREEGREPDPRSWAALEAAKAFLRGEITPGELAAARDAAKAAAKAAAYAAWAAAYAAAYAARDAARDAAWDAARAAWAAAYAAARAAERAWQRARFEELVTPRIEASMKAAGLAVTR